MLTNDGTGNDNGVGSKVRTIGILVLVALLSYEMGLSQGRAQKTRGDYAALRAEYSSLKAEYEQNSAQYSAMKTQCDQTLAQYYALRAQYDRIEAKSGLASPARKAAPSAN